MDLTTARNRMCAAWAASWRAERLLSIARAENNLPRAKRLDHRVEQISRIKAARESAWDRQMLASIQARSAA